MKVQIQQMIEQDKSTKNKFHISTLDGDASLLHLVTQIERGIKKQT